MNRKTINRFELVFLSVLIIIISGIWISENTNHGVIDNSGNDNSIKMNLTKELPLYVNFKANCTGALIQLTGNLWIDKFYDEVSNLNRYSVKVEVNEVGNKKYSIIAFLDKIGDVHEGGTGYVACDKHDIVPTSGTKTFTLDCNEVDVFQEVGDVSRMLLHTIPEDYKNDCNEEIELKDAIDKELFRPLIICSDGWSITKIGDDYVYMLKGVSFKLEVGKEFRFRVWEGEEAGTDYILSKKDNKFILDIEEWAIPPACENLLGCDKKYSFEIDTNNNSCIKK